MDCNVSSKHRYRHNKKKVNTAPQLKKGTCTICNERDSEVSMTCAIMHSYCFECVKKWTESSKEISCPNCRKVCSSIVLLPIDREKRSKELQNFIDSVKIIPNPRRHGHDCTCFEKDFDNTAIYPDWTIQHYVDNQNQLELYTSNKEKYGHKELSQLINWNVVSFKHRNSHHMHNPHVETITPDTTPPGTPPGSP
jgi:hypothetical protein